jgi:NCS1 family nucleobase:cation symporter-1
VGYSALLGPIGGILIADYFVLRRCQLDVAALYESDGEYRFTGGISWIAVTAFVLAVIPALPGFLAQVGAISAADVPPFLLHVYDYAWFAGFALAFLVYWALRALTVRGIQSVPTPLTR